MGKFLIHGNIIKYVFSKNEFILRQLKCENGDKSQGIVCEENVETPYSSEVLDFDQVAKISKMPVNEIHLKLLEIQEAFLMLGSTSPAKSIRVNIRVGKIMMQPISNGRRKLSFGQNPTSF